MTNNEQMSKTNNGKKLSALKSIRSYCKYHCCCNDNKSWKECALTSCFLYSYRFGVGNRSSKQKQGSTLRDFTKNEVLGDST